jgi:hypothetical protein
MGGLSKDSLLRSWKEIASYLGCDVRTCHRWEANRGMPVHRAEGGGTKSPVFAYKDELDVWFQGTFKNSNPPMEKKAVARPWLKWAIGGAAVLVLAGAFLVLRERPERRQPADFDIDGSFLVVLDKQKRELWRRDTGMENLWPESVYRINFQVMNTLEANILPVLVIKDIDADGDTEVLFAPRRKTDQTGEGILICYDRRGTKLWTFPAGKGLVCRDKIFSPDYRIAGFDCHDLDGDGRSEVVVESFQSPDWPCQLAVLDSSGKMIGEFWNTGYLRDLEYHDITGDGREELIVCGVNNEYRGGCLIVFDTRDIHGGSPASGEYVCQGIGPGSMLYYVITPYLDVSEASGDRVDGLRLIEVTKNSWIRATAPKGLIYEFDFGLACIQVSPGNVFKVLHKEFADAGKVTSVLGPEYMRKLREGIRWWNGSAMVPEPSMVRR